MFEYQSDPEVTVHLTFPPSTEIADSRAFLSRCLQVWADGSAFPMAITAIGDGRFIGMIESRIGPHGVELGYVLLRSEWGKGYMTEAVEAITSWALSVPSVSRVSAYCDVDNIRSQRVLEKAGFLKEGVLHRYADHPNASPEPRDAVMYARWV